MTGIPDQEITIRAGSFLAVFAFMSVWELLVPRRRLTTSKRTRWSSNISMVLFNSLSLRLIFPILAVDVAILAKDRGWGLLNQPGVSYWPAVVAGVVVLDFVIYLQHVMFHAVPALWRFQMHRVHHSVIRNETNSNFGFNLPWWDRLLGSYSRAPTAGHEGMTIGLGHLRDPKRLTFLWLLALPFIGKPGVYPINGGGRRPGQ